MTPDATPARTRRRVRTATALLTGALLTATAALAGTAAAAPATPAPTASASGAPALIPAPVNWTPATGTTRVGAGTRIATDTANLGTARQLAGEIRAAHGLRLPVVRGAAHRGDIVLRTDTGRRDLGAEGYALRVADRVTVTGRTGDGVFHGTRTVLQLLVRSTALPRGATRDVPAAGERAVGVCACYTYNTEAWFTRLIKDMAYLKLNTLHLELKVKSARYPEINTFSYYTPAEVRKLVALAARYHITVVPEINSPGHMDPYLTPYPGLQLTDTAGTPDPTRLDITDPAAFAFYTHLVDDDLKVFPAGSFHMGADEYMLRTDYSNYPELLAYAREKYGKDATPQDAYVDFVNRVDDYVRSKGRTLRIWNDGLTGENTVPLHKDIVVEHWLPEPVTAQQLLDDGHRVLNASDAWYYVRGGYAPDARKLYDADWSPADFSDGTVTRHTDGVTGAMYTVWPDNYGKETENQTERGMSDSLRAFAQGVWGGPRPTADYDGFTALADTLGHAPGWDVPGGAPVPGGDYRLRAQGGGWLTAPAPGTEPGTPLKVTRRGADGWRVEPTDDGYYRLATRDGGLCADVSRGARNNMGVVMESGAAATAETCADTASQKWQWEQVPGGHRLVDASTQQTLTATGTGGAVQRPRDVARRDVWRLEPADRTGKGAS
ncbi:family 20 glycosylhydrolase [Streptomyces sp. NPDC050560]|uniref:family 20 glycosylhydrolase n=1 Tax=Streptomyces sp. NPDC050560 TaxID=3365630 RepID=UPI0037ACBF27